MNPRAFRLAGVLALVVAVALAVVAGVVARSTHGFLDSAQRAEGVVVDLRERHSKGADPVAPVISFDADGQTYTFAHGTFTYPPRYELGDSVEVVFDAADPGGARIAGGFPYLATVILGAAAIVVGGIGVALLAMTRTIRDD